MCSVKQYCKTILESGNHFYAAWRDLVQKLSLNVNTLQRVLLYDFSSLFENTFLVTTAWGKPQLARWHVRVEVLRRNRFVTRNRRLIAFGFQSGDPLLKTRLQWGIKFSKRLFFPWRSDIRGKLFIQLLTKFWLRRYPDYLICNTPHWHWSFKTDWRFSKSISSLHLS